jgi:hypothetical protein
MEAGVGNPFNLSRHDAERSADALVRVSTVALLRGPVGYHCDPFGSRFRGLLQQRACGEVPPRG